MSSLDYSITYQDLYSWALAKGEVGDWSPWLEDEEDTENFQSWDSYQYLKDFFSYYDYPWAAVYGYIVRSEALDPLVDDIKAFFSNIFSFVWADQTEGSTWLGTLNHWLYSIWESVENWLAGIRDAIVDKVDGLANYVSNIYTWIVWNLVDDISDFVSNLFRPITDTWDTITTILETWFDYIYQAIVELFTDPVEWIQDTFNELEKWLAAVEKIIWDSLASLGDVVGAYIGAKLTEFSTLVTQGLSDILTYLWDTVIGGPNTFIGVIQDSLSWWWDAIKLGWIFVVDDIIPAVGAATTGAIGWLKDEFTNLMGTAYDELMEHARSYVPMTPEKSVELAGVMFGSAVGFGALAHGMALAVEAMPNLKWMGTHYLSAFVAHMGGFGAISSATMGVIAGLALRTPFTYYMQSLLRPVLPRSMDLQIMAVKPDIPIETFRDYMKYEGYSDYWIDAFERTMYREPRYFELSMMGEDDAATDEWLFTKARRAGYNEDDSRIFVSSLLKKVARTQRIELYDNASYAYKEGFITEDKFLDYLDALELRAEAKQYAIKAATLAYQSDVFKEWIALYKQSYRDDLISEADCRASLSALGMPIERVNAIVDLEWVKKQPKILKAERAEVEDQWRDVQAEYIRVYIEGFRRGIITESQLVTYFTAIGMDTRVAEAKARLEAIKLVPKFKPAEITVPVIPVPPTPPKLE